MSVISSCVLLLWFIPASLPEGAEAIGFAAGDETTGNDDDGTAGSAAAGTGSAEDAVVSAGAGAAEAAGASTGGDAGEAEDAVSGGGGASSLAAVKVCM